MKPLIFMSGQLTAVAGLAVSEDWGFTRTARKLQKVQGGFKAEGMIQTWEGGIYYAADPDVARATTNLIVLSEVPSWPDPLKLMRMVDRHRVAYECSANGFFGSDICEIASWSEYSEKNPNAVADTVVKTGNEHSGEGKILVGKGLPFTHWDGLATIQPFFSGRSVRVLHVGSEIFFVETVHASSWIKNSPGGENIKIDSKDVPENMVEHSFKVRDHFGLDVCGNDYILENDGTFHFLETNQFPGLGDDFFGDFPRDFFRERMRSLEKIVTGSEDVLRPAVLTA